MMNVTIYRGGDKVSGAYLIVLRGFRKNCARYSLVKLNSFTMKLDKIICQGENITEQSLLRVIQYGEYTPIHHEDIFDLFLRVLIHEGVLQ